MNFRTANSFLSRLLFDTDDEEKREKERNATGKFHIFGSVKVIILYVTISLVKFYSTHNILYKFLKIYIVILPTVIFAEYSIDGKSFWHLKIRISYERENKTQNNSMKNAAQFKCFFVVFLNELYFSNYFQI